MDKKRFIEIFNESIKKTTFVKMTLSKYVGEIAEVQNLYVRLVEIKQTLKVSFLWRYKTKDITQNLELQDAITTIDDFLGKDFLNADLFTSEADYTLMYNKKREPKLLQKKSSLSQNTDLQHNREKKRIFKLNNNAYLGALGITNANGEILKEGQKKYRQIDKYIEIIDATLHQHPLKKSPHIVDMGSGKGYLTFALYDYLNNNLQAEATMTGIELRENLVDFCNDLAKKSNFSNLNFVAQDIFDYQPKRIDMLIALHACDIATDIAIAKGIAANAEIIVVAPCCHKQIRKEMNTQSAMNSILKFGIMEERQAELLTDGIRALLLEAHGYQVKALEFVSLEHTPKNMMLIGVKGKANPEALGKIAEIKAQFGIKTHYLETLLK
jgi:SAM-dependent methyltransferase